jgi:hypothetical protein
VQGLKEQAGNTRVGNALIDVATNPLVWLGLAFSPSGARALQSGRVFLSEARNTWLPHVWRTGWQFLDGTAGGPVIQSMARAMRNATHEWSSELIGHEQAIIRGLGLSKASHFLRPKLIKDPAVRERVEQFHDAVGLKMSRLDEPMTNQLDDWAPEFYAVKLRPGEEPEKLYAIIDQDVRAKLWRQYKSDRKLVEGGVLEHEGLPVQVGRQIDNEWSTLRTGQRVQEPLVMKGEPDRVIDSVRGGREYVDALERAGLQRLIRLVGKESYQGVAVTPELVQQMRGAGRLREMVDPDKILRLKRGYQDSYLKMAGRQLYENDLLQMLMSRGTRAGILHGNVPEGKFVDALVDGWVSSVNAGQYFPRNTVEFWGRKGKTDFVRVPDEALTFEHRDKIVTASARTRERGPESLVYSFDTLDRLEGRFHVSPQYWKELN